MKNNYTRIFTSILALAACYWLVKKAYSGQDLGTIWGHIKEVDLKWVAVITLCTLACHLIRTLRWQMLLHASGKEVNLIRLFGSLMSGYFVNQALPRVGELVRPYLLNRSDRISYGISIGTVVAERLIDTVCLAILLFSCFFLINDLSLAFAQQHIYQPLKSYLGEMPFWKIGIAFLGLVGLLYFIIARVHQKSEKTVATGTSENNVVEKFADESWEGIAAVSKVEKPLIFWSYTVIIWVLYFLMTFLWFFSLEETSQLGVKEGIFIWAIGSIGRMVPTQGGGAGAYHYLVIQAFVLFGISNSVGGAMALLIHGLQTAVSIVIGSLSLVLYMALTLKEKPAPIPEHLPS